MGETSPSPHSFRRPVALSRAVVRHALATDVPFMAAAIAYQAFVSLLPLLFLLVVVTTTLGDAALTERLLTITAGQLPADAQQVVREAARNAAEQTGNSVVGAVVLGFGVFAVFNGFDKAFSRLYDVDRGETLPNQLRDALVVLGALGSALLVIAASWRLGALVDHPPVGGLFRSVLLQSVLLAAGLVIAFYPMFYVFPELQLGWREVLPGVVVSAVGWTALQALFQLYTQFVARSDAFGAVSSALVFATWLYFSGFVLLLGGALNAVLHGRSAGTDRAPGVAPADSGDGT